MTLAPELAPGDRALLSIPESRAQVEWAICLADFPEFLTRVNIARAIPKGGMLVTDADAGELPYELWPHLLRRARAWQSRTHHEIVLKARQLGLSWLAATYAAWTIIRQASAKVLLISQTDADAAELMTKVQFVIDHYRYPSEACRPRYAKRNTEEVGIVGGGDALCVPSTPRGGRGFTATVVIVDEAAHHQWAQKNWSAYSPAAMDGGQIIILSTAAGTTGFFADAWDEALATPGGAFEPVFIGALERPDRDMDWYRQARSLWKGLPAEFPQEYPLQPSDAFVRLTGLVFPQYGPQHQRTDDPWPWHLCEQRYIGSDYGGGDPTALVALGVYRDPRTHVRRVHQYGELYKRNGAPTVTELYGWLLGWYGWDPEAQTFHTPAVYIGDPIGEQIVNRTLAGMMPNGTVMVPKLLGRWEGLATTAWYLEQEVAEGEPLFTINIAACPNSHREFASYRWQTTTDPNDKSRYATTTPHDHHGDAMDARRYALNVIYTNEFGRADNRQPMTVVW